MTARLQDGGDPLWGPVVYDGSKKGEYIPHSLGGGGFATEPLIHSASAEDRRSWIEKVTKRATETGELR